MDLLPLPRQNKKKEADFGIEIKHWIEKHASVMITCSLEAKHTRGKDSLPFSEVKSEQIAFALRISSDKGAWIRTLGMNGEPDYIFLRNEVAYIAIKYIKFFCVITIGNFLYARDTTKKKSLSAEHAREISSYCG